MKNYFVKDGCKDGDVWVNTLEVDGKTAYVGGYNEITGFVFESIQPEDKYMEEGMKGPQTGSRFINSFKSSSRWD
jgi:hypothetical protein